MLANFTKGMLDLFKLSAVIKIRHTESICSNDYDHFTKYEIYGFESTKLMIQII